MSPGTKHSAPSLDHVIAALVDTPRVMGRSRVRLACGRWLALRRLRCTLSIADIAERCGIDQSELVLLEAGLISTPLPGHAFGLLAAILGDGQPEYAAAVLAAATIGTTEPQILQAVHRELTCTTYRTSRPAHRLRRGRRIRQITARRYYRRSCAKT